MRADEFIWEVRDKALNIVGQIRPEDLVVQANILKNQVGTWKVTLPVEHPMTAHLRTPGAGIRVSVAETGTVLFSGPTVRPESVASTGDPAGTVTIDGVTDDVHMGDRLVVPDPATAELDEQGLAHDVRTGNTEDLMYQYVNVNAGPGAVAVRRVANLEVNPANSEGRGPVVKKSARFPKLGNLLNELAAGTRLYWGVKQVGNKLHFGVEAGRDYTAEIRLDIYNNTLSGHRVAIGPPGATRVLVAGQGNLTDRQFIELTNADATAAEALWGRRIERFVDQRQTDDLEELTRAGEEVLEEEGFSVIAVQIVPMEDSLIRFWWDWFIADEITVVVEGQEMVAEVTGYVMKIDSNGARVGAVLGDPTGFSSDLALAKRVDGIALRVDNLERADSGVVPDQSITANQLQDGAVTNAKIANGAINSDKLMPGNLVVRDSFTQTKAYRFRVTGSDLDLDFAAKSLYISPAANADFTGSPGPSMVLTQDREVRIEGKLIAQGGADASTDGGNRPPLIVGSPAGSHMRMDGNEIIGMTSDTAAATIYINNTAFNPEGGPVAYARDYSGDLAIGTTETAVLTIGSMTFRSGRAYRVAYHLVGSGAGQHIVRMRVAGAAGPGIYGDVGHWGGGSDGSRNPCSGETVVINTGGDVTTSVVLTYRGSGGAATPTVRVSQSTPLWLEVYDAGPASRWPGAHDIDALT